MATIPSPTSRKRARWLGWTIALVAILGGSIALPFYLLNHHHLLRRLPTSLEPWLRQQIIAQLSDRFHARVELDELHVNAGAEIQVTGGGLRLWPRNTQQDSLQGAPLFSVAQFDFHAGWDQHIGDSIHISSVHVSGLNIHIPPRSRRSTKGINGASASRSLPTLVVDEVLADQAHLILETDKPNKLPMDFALSKLHLEQVSSTGPIAFTVDMVNPKPIGDIHSTGSFGPWQPDDPASSPVLGDYSFQNADLSTIKGIGGILSSTGHYTGTLRSITVNGVTDTPNFRLARIGTGVPLHTIFHAIVDGTNGDTWLDPVNATLGHSHITARGQVVRAVNPDGTGARGHDINLNVTVGPARIEDILRLSAKAETPILTGNLHLTTALHIPPADLSVLQRMELNGRFTLDQARFNNETIQQRITQLSLRGQGQPDAVKTADPTETLSAMSGNFNLHSTLLTLTPLDYKVPGADITVNGTYALETSTMQFTGAARLDATLSEVIGGKWGALLKPANGLFRKHGAGTEVPIHINGTRQSPKFGVDFKKLSPF